MKLEFREHLIPASLCQELGLDKYLSCFDIDIPMLPKKVLEPLAKNAANQHYQLMRFLEERTSAKQLEEIILLNRQLPNLESCLTFFSTAMLEPFHIFRLGHFISKNKVLGNFERKIGCEIREASVCDKIEKVLLRFVENDYSSLILNPAERKVADQLAELDQKCANAIEVFEREILRLTNMKMIYPYLKELPNDYEDLERIRSCQLINLLEKGDRYVLDYHLTNEIRQLLLARQELSERVEETYSKKMHDLNGQLGEFVEPFKVYYEKRRTRCYYYALLAGLRNHKLCLPEFQTRPGFYLEQAVLPCLKEQEDLRYVPLTLGLDRGSNILFGSNMTGKSTVLKTLYFHLALIQVGLPVPATRIKLSFPEHIQFLFKSTGNLQHRLSSFGEEMQFLSRALVSANYVLVDELFQSTDPVSGMELAEMVVEEFVGKECVFLCTTHYANLFKLPLVNLLRMKDFDMTMRMDEKISVKNIIDHVPYEVEKIAGGSCEEMLKQNIKPLYIALYFPIPETLKAKIQTRLASYVKE